MVPRDTSEALDTSHFHPFRGFTHALLVHRVCGIQSSKIGASEATVAQRSEVQVTGAKVEQSLAQKDAHGRRGTVTTRAKAFAQEGGASGPSDTP